jgi:hypothetical protein
MRIVSAICAFVIGVFVFGIEQFPAAPVAGRIPIHHSVKPNLLGVRSSYRALEPHPRVNWANIIAYVPKPPIIHMGIGPLGGSRVLDTAKPAPTPTGNLASDFACIAHWESNSNPADNTGNGYYGMFQFSLPTWRSVGGVGLPSDASAATQLALAIKLQARSGWGQWPVTSRKCGL